MKDTLTSLYEGNTLISENNKLLVASHSLPIGKRNSNDTDKSGALENSTILENQFISLLPVYDFLNASLDKNCNSTTAESCTNYNYLAKYKFNWWLITTSSKNSHQVFKVGNSISIATASSSNYLRPVIYLNNDAMYVKGDGSKENPYIVK